MTNDIEELVEEFTDVLDPMERFELLMDKSILVSELADHELTPETKVKGCQSIAHVISEYGPGGFRIRGYADSQLVKGMMGILSIVVRGLEPAQVVQISPEFMLRLGLTNTLTPSRSNGFRNMFDMVRRQAAEMVQ